ncbi:TPA: hypothetical protein ACX3EK_002627 [Vibrio parahaemolyticus]|uniref:hypothetical protein n=1 Tax=Vibrio harveyi group TaxID=717610 RepID=UPI0004719D4D|nr:hypothetical protein [Vibrio parahaemolyticus]ELA7188783.1 hypothetical protein [Vibrio alginolyticus]EIC2574690.1 hypothetical protein [Vibrio parahaemolyticus]EID0036252.1 hypothetical protein [Vibrio parahaemolyticus]ELA7285642.1 hypothetical protein [Vibrio parahaemolyticus]ELA7843658.1 hypothetical protein [Vibrio parahaemolyticus]
MKYRLGLKEITEDDVNAQCPFMPEPEDYQMYVAAFADDFNQLDIVESAVVENNSVIIKLAEGADIEQLRQVSISIHQNYWDYLRTTGFEKIA